MASRDSLDVRKLLETGVVVQQSADTPIALRMRYVGTGSATSVTVNTATTLVTVSVETSGTVTKTYTFGTTPGCGTVGGLADAINSDGLFEVKVLDALRSDVTTASYFTLGTTLITPGMDANGVQVWDATCDTSVYKAVTSCITNARNFNTLKLSTSHRVHLQEIKYYATLGGANSNLVRVYLRRGNVETQVFGELSVSAAATTINFASGYGKISGKDGDEIIARLQDGTSLADAALSFRAVGILE
jgi:hypothetical protein